MQGELAKDEIIRKMKGLQDIGMDGLVDKASGLLVVHITTAAWFDLIYARRNLTPSKRECTMQKVLLYSC